MKCQGNLSLQRLTIIKIYNMYLTFTGTDLAKNIQRQKLTGKVMQRLCLSSGKTIRIWKKILNWRQNFIIWWKKNILDLAGKLYHKAVPAIMVSIIKIYPTMRSS